MDIGATSDVRIAGHVAPAILQAVTEEAGTALCMASHGRTGLGTVVLGSVATDVLAHSEEPVILVGPHFDAGRSLTDGPVLACVDGTPESESILPLAASWAVGLGVPLGISTVAEPLPAPLDDHRYRRHHGPEIDADVYVDQLVDGWRSKVPKVVGHAIYDPIGPAEGLAAYLKRRRAALIVINTRVRTGVARAVLGSEAARILSMSPVPVLMVPRPHG